MRRLIALVAILLTLGMAGDVWAYKCPQVQDATTRYVCTQTVFNDQGATIVSTDVVAWDDDDTDFSTSEYPYVTLTTTADDPYTAGVVAEGQTCPDQSLCDIVVYGPATVQIADSTDDATVDTLVATSSVSGSVGDAGTTADTCSLGMLVDVASGATTDNAFGTVFVNVDCR